jgi:hypothetical protein
MSRISGASPEHRRAMGAASEALSRQFTPERWAQVLLSRVPDLRAELGLAGTAPARTNG